MIHLDPWCDIGFQFISTLVLVATLMVLLPSPEQGKIKIYSNLMNTLFWRLLKWQRTKKWNDETFLRCLKPKWQLKMCKGSYVSYVTQFSEEGIVDTRYNPLYPLYEVGVLSQCYMIPSCNYLQTVNIKVYIFCNCQLKVQINLQYFFNILFHK